MPDIFDDLLGGSSTAASDSSGIHPDVIRTIIGEGDPAYVASVLANRKAKSGQDYEKLITEPSQFEARTGDAWSSNGKISETDPRYIKALQVAGPILRGDAKPVTDADSFYSPTTQKVFGRAKPAWDDGSGTSGPDGQLYFKDKYAPPAAQNQDIYDELKLGSPAKTASAPDDKTPGTPNPAEAAQLAVDLEGSKDNPNWPVYDSYNKVGRNSDGSIAYVGNPGKGGETDSQGRPIVNIASSSQPEDIQRWLKQNPNDIANKGSQVLAKVANDDELMGGLQQGLANVKNSVEGGVNAVLPGHPLNNDLARQLLNRQNNDQTYQGNPFYGVGKFVGESAATAPVMAIPGLDAVEGGNMLAQAARFVGGAGGEGNALLRGASLASKGALQGGETAALTSAGSNQDFGQQVAGGAITGGVAAPAFAGAQSLLKYAPKVSEITRDLADKAVNKYGIDLNIPQIKNASGSVVKPTILDEPKIAQQRQQFTGAVLKDIGATPEEARQGPTEDVLSTLQERTGNSMNQFTSGKLVNGSGFDDVKSKLTDLKADLDESEFSGSGGMALKKTIDKIIKKGELSGDYYKQLTTSGTPFYRLQNSDDKNVRHFAGKVRDVLDDAFEGTHNPDEPDFQWGNLSDKIDLDRFRADRMNYKKIMTVADMSNKFAPDGMIEPSEMQSAVNRRFGKRAFMGADNFGELADIGQAFLTKTQPQTTKSWIISHTPIGAAIAAGEIGSMAIHNPLTAAGTLGAGLMAAGAGKALNSSATLRNRMLRPLASSVTNPNPLVNKFSIPATILADRAMQGQ